MTLQGAQPIRKVGSKGWPGKQVESEHLTVAFPNQLRLPGVPTEDLVNVWAAKCLYFLMLSSIQQSPVAATLDLLRRRVGTQVGKAVPGDQLHLFLPQGSFGCQLPPRLFSVLGSLATIPSDCWDTNPWSSWALPPGSVPPFGCGPRYPVSPFPSHGGCLGKTAGRPSKWVHYWK